MFSSSVEGAHDRSTRSKDTAVAATTGVLVVEILGRRGGVPLAYGLGLVTVPPSGQRLSVHVSRLDSDGGADLAGFQAR